MIAPLTEQALDLRVASVMALLDRIGEATANDVGTDDPERVVTVRANAPLDPLYALAEFEYTEIYRKLPQGEWLLTDYYYEFRQQPPPGRRAHHCHDRGPITSTASTPLTPSATTTSRVTRPTSTSRNRSSCSGPRAANRCTAQD